MMNIDAVGHGDLAATADLHRRYLHLGLFPQLGKTFLRHYQETFADSPFGIALVARDDDDGVVGALFGTSANARHYQWVMRHRGAELAAFGAFALMLRPKLAYAFLSTRLGRYANGARRHLMPAAASAPQPARQLSVLSHIVTDEHHRHRGIGRALVEEFEYLARKAGAKRALLVTEDGGLGQGFFERIGGVCMKERGGFDGSIVRDYQLDLGGGPPYEPALGESRDPTPVARPGRVRPDVYGPSRAGVSATVH